jgi:hypothetical protein
MSIFSWKMTPQELETQVKQYHTLKVTQSYRGIAALLIVASMILTGLLVLFGAVSFDSLYGAVIYRLGGHPNPATDGHLKSGHHGSERLRR